MARIPFATSTAGRGAAASLRSGGAESARIDLGPELNELSAQIIETIAPRTGAAMRAALDEVVRNALRHWPIGRDRKTRTKHSIELFSHGVFVSPAGIVAEIRNAAPYAASIGRKHPGDVFYIPTRSRAIARASGFRGRSRFPWVYLLAQPMDSVGDRVLDVVADEIGDL